MLKFYSRLVNRHDHEPLVVRGTRAGLKRGLRAVAPAPAEERQVLLVFGCQRSGTTMLQQSLLDRSWRVIILGEHDRMLVRANDPERLRWDNLDLVSSRMMALPFELVVAKPLVESHRVRELLSGFRRAQAIWMLRHYIPVARSNLRRFGLDNGYRDLRALAEGGADWRSAATDEVRDHVASLLASDLSPLDAAAVFWWARNQLYLDQELWSDDRVRIMRYEDVTKHPQESLEALSEFLSLQLPLKSMTRGIRSASGSSGELRSDVERLCSELWKRFDAAPRLLARKAVAHQSGLSFAPGATHGKQP